MTRQLSFLALVSAFGLFATGAQADGMVQHAPPPCCDAPFAGAYFGVALGYGQHRTENTNETVGAFSEGVTFKDTEGGVTVGGYAGYNWQHCCHPFVFGVETDFNWLNTSPTAFDIEAPVTTPPPGGTGTETVSLQSKMDWFGTLRVRAGYVVHDNWLLYATGGLAYAQIDHKFNDDNVNASGGPGFGPFSQSNTDTKAGWTVGGGAEFLHDTHWLLRAEALFVDLGSETHSYTLEALCAAGAPSCTATGKWDDQFWVARLGLAYKFDDARPVVPLK